jgi:hypothetical protein
MGDTLTPGFGRRSTECELPGASNAMPLSRYRKKFYSPPMLALGSSGGLDCHTCNSTKN